MGLGGRDFFPADRPLARPLYRDDTDGTQNLKLSRLLSSQLSKDDRGRLLTRLQRAVTVTRSAWAALLLGHDDGFDVMVTDGTPAAFHRHLGDARLEKHDSHSSIILPAHLINRAASQGFAVEGARVASREGDHGFVILGFPLWRQDNQSHRDLVELVADEIGGFIESHSLAGQIDRIKSHLSLVHRLGQQVTAIHDREELFGEITRLIHHSLGYEHIQLIMVDPVAGTVGLAHASGPFAEELLAEGFEEPIGRGIVGRVAETGRIWMSADVTVDKHFVSNALLPNTASELALPLRLGKRVIGVLDIQSDHRDAFRPDDVILLQTIADQIAPAIEQHRLFAAERHERELADTLADVSRIISSTLDLDDVLAAVLQELARVVPHQGSQVVLRGPDGLMRVVAAKGYPDNDRVRSFVFAADEAPLSRPILDERQTLILSDVTGEARWFRQPGTEQVRSWCSAPLVFGDDCVGWICVDWSAPDFFTPAHGRIVRAFADQAVVAIENARLFAGIKELSEILEQKVQERTVELRDAHDEIARKADELRALWRRVVGIQEEERQRIAYDLHDSVAQSILASTYRLQGVRKRIHDNPDADARLIECQQMLDATLQEMKRIIYALRPNVLDELGLIPALESYMAGLGAHHAVAAVFNVSGQPFELRSELELAIYRIVQEACQNALRHSGAPELRLDIEYAAPSLRVAVHDNGCGFDLESARHGLGLASIRERAQAVGARVEVATSRGSGTLIELELVREMADAD